MGRTTTARAICLHARIVSGVQERLRLGRLTMARRPLEGSEKRLSEQARDLGPADSNERLEVTVLLRRRQSEQLRSRAERLRRGDRSGDHMSREDFASQFGADPADMGAVAAFAQGFGLSVVARDPARRTMVMAGTVAQADDAFGVDLRRIQHPEGSYRGRTGAIQLPEELHGVIEAVLGLDNRPAAKPHFRRSPAVAARAVATSFAPAQIAALYGFPGGTGAGETVGIIELGGGFTPKDLDTYFANNGISPTPSVTAVSVDQAVNQPSGGSNGPDGEVMLDIEVVEI